MLNKNTFIVFFVLIVSLNNYAQITNSECLATLNRLEEEYNIGHFEKVNSSQSTLKR